MKRVMMGAGCALLVAACAGSETETDRGLGVDVASFDTSVRPQDDFFRYVNGTWIENTKIPPDRSNYGSFTQLFDWAEADLKEIIEEAAAADAAEGTDEQKLGDVYRSFMNTDEVERRGLTPLAGELEHIDGLATPADVVEYFGYAQTAGVQSPIGLFVNQDAKNATAYITYLSQSGLGLPDRDYYFNEDARFAEIRDKYLEHIQRMFEMAGFEDPAGSARAIMDLETAIARSHWTRVQNRDRDSTYNKVDLAGAAKLAPGFDWQTMLTAAELPGVEALIVRQPSYLEALDGIVRTTPVARWRTYLRWKLLDAWAADLPQRFVDADFDFYGRTLRGTEENRPRWKRAVSAVRGTMGELLGQAYVARHFQAEKKARMDELVANLREAFRQAIDELEWMGEETKVQAHLKLEKFVAKIGYPDEWKDYSALEVRDDDLVGNLMRSNAVEYHRMIDKLGKPVDRGEWFMTPQTVNAYYNPPMNEIVFPAAILQPPFFNVEADDATNYGAIGAVIGHEFSHGFDDQGRKSDGDGNLRDWWTEQDAAEFKRRADGLVAQYSAFNPIDDMRVNGELTLGENIGDLAGLTMAYRAYRLSLGGKEPPVIDGFTGDQRFFMGWAQVWRRKYRDDELRRRLVTDPHSPSQYRTNGIVSNMPAFYRAFDVQEGDGMYRASEDRVKIW
ncbi:MAG: M13 family metallopeptidase [Gemmatimonadota bacterium]